MPKEFEVKYGKEIYKRNALTGANLDYLGLRLFPKVVGFGATVNTLMTRRFIENENHFSIYQSLKDIFDADDWKWLIDVILYDFENPICVNKRYLTTEDEVNEHFAGDFVRKYTVVLQLAYQNLGEFSVLMPSLQGLFKNIVSYLEGTVAQYLNQAEQSIKSYASKEKQEKKTTQKPKNK